MGPIGESYKWLNCLRKMFQNNNKRLQKKKRNTLMVWSVIPHTPIPVFLAIWLLFKSRGQSESRVKDKKVMLDTYMIYYTRCCPLKIQES